MTKTKKKPYKFQGTDWCELAECWKLKCPEDSNEFGARDKWLAAQIRDKMWEALNQLSMFSYLKKNSPKKEVEKTKQTLSDVRRFLKTLSKERSTYKYPVWEAISNIKNEETMIQFVDILLESMWC